MAERRVAHVRLEVDADADPIAGVVRQDGEPVRPFAGWLELTRTIERSLETARRDDRDPHGPEGSR
jgi:hypothetical protein